MKNLLGQTVNPGDLVYRGARQGDSSEFKVGRVQYIKNGKARVNWLYDLEGSVHRGDYRAGTFERISVPRPMESAGNPSVSSLVVISEGHIDRLEKILKFAADWKDGMDTKVYNELVDNLPLV